MVLFKYLPEGWDAVVLYGCNFIQLFTKLTVSMVVAGIGG